MPCSPGWPQTHYVVKADLELLNLLPLPPKCLDNWHAAANPARSTLEVQTSTHSVCGLKREKTCGNGVPAQPSSPSQPGKILLSGYSVVIEATSMSPLESSLHTPRLRKHWLPLAECEHTHVCVQAPLCQCPSCNVLFQVRCSLLLAWSLGLGFLFLRATCYGFHLRHSVSIDPPLSGNPPFVQIHESRGCLSSVHPPAP